MDQQLSARLVGLQTAAREAIIGLAKNVPYNRGRRSMPKSLSTILLAITLLALTSVASAVLADAGYSPGLRSGMMGNMGGGGMMRSMKGCSAMLQGGSHSGRPNEQWRDGRRSIPGSPGVIVCQAVASNRLQRDP
jgi:hypothetical protein